MKIGLFRFRRNLCSQLRITTKGFLVIKDKTNAGRVFFVVSDAFNDKTIGNAKIYSTLFIHANVKYMQGNHSHLV